jgi:hypothetical protein
MDQIINNTDVVFYDEKDDSLFRDIVVLYCPQKVGSTSLITSLRLSATKQLFTMHTHDNIILKNSISDMDLCITDILNNTSVFNIQTQEPRRIYIIDVYRTPMERKISEFFHEISTFHFNNEERKIASYPLSKIIQRFNNVFPYTSNEDYFREKFGLNTDELPREEDQFDFQKKYLLIEKNGVSYIKLRLKDSHEWGRILTKLLGVEITIVKDYETSEKDIGIVYQQFLREYKLPFNFFKMLEECKQLKYYYDFQERSEYLMTWWKRISGLYIPWTKEEYLFYKNISFENKSYFLPLKRHYKDDGCLCERCKIKRAIVLETIHRTGDNKHFSAVYHETYNEDKTYKEDKTYTEERKNKIFIRKQVGNIFLDYIYDFFL